MSAQRLTCSADGCGNEATTTLYLRGQIGHVHDCPRDAATLREWCDVVHSDPIIDGRCPAIACTTESIWFGAPTPLEAGATSDD